jgi:hypothetical protein
MTNTKILELAKREFDHLKGRFGRDDERILNAMVHMCSMGYVEVHEEIPEIPGDIEQLIHRWRGDSRGGGLESAMVSVWKAGQKLAANS